MRSCQDTDIDLNILTLQLAIIYCTYDLFHGQQISTYRANFLVHDNLLRAEVEIRATNNRNL